MKKLTLLLASIMLTLCVLTHMSYAAPSNVLYETRTVEQITEGVTYEKNSRLYDRGWLDIFVLNVDINNPNIKLDVLESTAEYGLKETVETLAKQNGAVAAVNADFFGAGTVASSMGIVIRDGTVDSVQNYYNSSTNEYPAFLVDNNLTPFIDFVRNPYIGFYNGPQAIIQLSGKNKVNGMSQPIYFDAEKTTADLDKRYTNLWKIVVEAGKIKYISKAGETVDIPEGGYAIVLDNKTATEHIEKFSVGQQAYFNETYKFIAHPNKDIESIILGISGGGKILEGGAYIKDQGIIIDRDKRHPRTAIGVSKDKSKVIIMAVDGRTHSIGATHSEIAELLLEYGAYNAMHFDGGGSTTVVTRPLGENQVKVVNTVSEGTQRKVANGLGIFSNSEPGSLAGMKLSIANSPDNLVFEGIDSEIIVKGYDEHFNPVNASNYEIVYSNYNIEGTWNGNRFRPAKEGKGVLVAEYNGVKSELPVTVISKPVSMRITPVSFNVALNATASLKVELTNKDGYGISVPANSVNWTVTNNVGAVDNGTFTGTTTGAANIIASFGELTAMAEVTVGTTAKGLSSLETEDTISFTSYPDTVTGSVAYSTYEKYDGEKSLALNYSFLSNSTVTQAAYIDFKDSSIATLSNLPQAISVWVKGDNTNNMLRARFTDANGNYHTVDLLYNLNFNEWKYAFAPVPTNVAQPLKLDRIYVVSLNTEEVTPSRIYIDYIATHHAIPALGNVSKSTGFVDYMKQNLNTPIPDGSFDITIFGPTSGKNIINNPTVKAQVISKMQQNSSVAVFAGETNLGDNKISINTMQWSDTYRQNGYRSIKLIELATSAGGLRTTYANQWKELEGDLYTTQQQNVLLILNKNMWSGEERFSDSKEAELLHSVLKKFQQNTGKNVMVISGCGNSSGITVRDAIRYVSLNGLWLKDSTSFSDCNILRIRANENSMNYDLQKVY